MTGALNLAASYVYDPVGEPQAEDFDNAGVSGRAKQLQREQRTDDGHLHANGNTTASIGQGHIYDFENHLIQAGGITYTCDGDGNRLKKVVGGVTTEYTVDSRNPTGFAQVLVDWNSNAGLTYYICGLKLLGGDS